MNKPKTHTEPNQAFIQQTFNPPFWDHVGFVQFKLCCEGIRFKIGDGKWFFVPLGSRECTKGLLTAAKQRKQGKIYEQT